MSNISQSFKDFAKVGFLGVFNGDAWDAAFNSSYVGGVFSGIMLIVAFCLVRSEPSMVQPHLQT